MNPINTLGIRVAGLTGTIILLLASLLWGGKYLWQRSTEEPPLATTSTSEESYTDTDGDGLPDRFEAMYQTDPNNPDTDGDGTRDFAEITSGKDPAVAGIQDESKPATGDAVTSPTNYTEKYLAGLPTDASRTDILNKTKLEAFISANQGELLPSPAPSTVKISPTASKEAAATYLDQIAASHNPQLAVVNNDDIQQAFAASQQGNTKLLEDIINKLDQNIRLLRTIEAPTDATALHTQLLAASEALLRNVQLLAAMPDDFVGGLIGSKNIEDLGPVFQDIAQQISALETKYNLE